VSNLLALYREQLRRVSGDPEKLGICEQASTEAANYLPPKVVKVVTISSSRIGHFIGPGGSNIRDLCGRVPGSFLQLNKGQQSGGRIPVAVYGTDDAAVERSIALLRRYA
jgi:KH domain